MLNLRIQPVDGPPTFDYHAETREQIDAHVEAEAGNIAVAMVVDDDLVTVAVMAPDRTKLEWRPLGISERVKAAMRVGGRQGRAAVPPAG